MNPTPDRNKECLPPKKRESRQSSAEQRPLEDDFKPPAPLRTRPLVRHLESREGTKPHHYDKDLPPPTPPLPPPSLPHSPLALPWHMSYSISTPHPLLPVDRHGTVSPSWRDTCGRLPDVVDPQIPHSSRWFRTEVPSLAVQSPLPLSYKSPYVSDRDMWSYLGPSRRDYSPSLFSPAHHLFSQPAPYPPDPLQDARLRYPGRRPNGLDGLDNRPVSLERAPSRVEYNNDSRARLETSHTNGRKRHQEDATGLSQTKGTLLSKDCPNAHSSPQTRDWDRDRDIRRTPRTSHSHVSDSGAAKVEPPGTAASQTGAQIFYALGSVYPSLQQMPPTYPHLSSAGTPPYTPPPNKRNSQLSPPAQHNSYGPDLDQDVSPGLYRTPAQNPDPNLHPTAVLPHFTKGSLIELAGGRLKRVEDMRTEDFLRSADTLPEFHLSTCTVLLISPSPTHGFNQLQVLLADRNTQELLTVLAEYPFFVRDRGWSSCCPERSAQLYGLSCRQLHPGDVCLALTPKPNPSPVPARAHTTNRATSGTEPGPLHEERMPPPPPPPPLPLPSPTPPSTERDNKSHETPRPRKRRWSAPELHGQQQGAPPLDLPQPSKMEKKQ
ncbi:inactive histone-lysine N-methyltransferase 2E [Denticeps clupeoides]|uniref:AXH domain-containing protein n=1 Tax=Denticeps clupeoides TaxID=299321 RepID=A0AAY4CX08_9TELE|nr:inactive histone-lysine N-methyltransferase 2E-like [Denticeps clupeoides]XP_028849841.1 inactive histone-lysine N-methyltransferase 2E-like [Denticeps clupeoides]